jgi:hypothetical protein
VYVESDILKRWYKGGGVSVGKYLVTAFFCTFQTIDEPSISYNNNYKTKLLLVSVEMYVIQQFKHLSQRLGTIRKPALLLFGSI